MQTASLSIHSRRLYWASLWMIESQTLICVDLGQILCVIQVNLWGLMCEIRLFRMWNASKLKWIYLTSLISIVFSPVIRVFLLLMVTLIADVDLVSTLVGLPHTNGSNFGKFKPFVSVVLQFYFGLRHLMINLLHILTKSAQKKKKQCKSNSCALR